MVKQALYFQAIRRIILTRRCGQLGLKGVPVWRKNGFDLNARCTLMKEYVNEVFASRGQRMQQHVVRDQGEVYAVY